ncbi:hypothetical protein [Hymenobacter sp. BRD67]|uniref:hypothetical protein n=1 Tax=Hymenobacter sp. BRD67 TaxID=2675877 RepID=UPI001567BFF5|nr:hypothetical protein [Hymenobacter sp. BRD67]QKG55102.1 hypothetical protein GKZ67_22025 [Hymenobacter sp. BRD67]
MENLNPTPDLDVSQLSAVELQRLGVTIAQVRATYADPVTVIEPDAASDFPRVWRLFGFIGTGRFLFVALEYDGSTGKFAALGVKVASTVDEVRYYLCGSGAV